MATTKTTKAAPKAAKPNAKATETKAGAKTAAKSMPSRVSSENDMLVNTPPASNTKTKTTVKPSTTQTVTPSFKPYVPKKDEIYMCKEQLTHFADILTHLKDDLMADIERTVHTMQDEQTVFADPNDRASQETDMALELRNRDRERKLIKKIEETLDRIKADDYGFCDKCGIEIGIQRLEARPTATLCIDCKTLEELREKQVAK